MNIAEQLFDKGYAEVSVQLLEGKVSCRLRNLSASNQLELEKFMSDVEGSTAYILHTYSIELLSRTLKKYNKTSFESPEQAKNLLDTLPGIVIDFLVKEQNKFEKSVAKAYTGEEIEDNFFENPSTDLDSKEQAAQETSGNETVTKR